MFRLQVHFKSKIQQELWDEISNYLFTCNCIGIDEGEQEPEHLLLQAADEFLAAIEPVILKTPLKFYAYFNSESDALTCLDNFKNKYFLYIDKVDYHEEDDIDYSSIWKDNFKPIEINESIIIRAPWHKIESKYPYHLIIEPGMAFGTGSHETTKTCIELIQMIKSKSNFNTILDFGCGSGILAIAAKVLGAKSVYGVDIDPLSIESSITNAQLNNVDIEVNIDYEKLSIHQKSAAPYYDGIIANILKNTLLEFSDRFNLWLKPNGFLILSGILKEQADDISIFFQNKGFVEHKRITKIDSTLKEHSKFNDQIWEWTSLLLIKT